MTHGITDQEWNDYLDGTAEQATRDRIETHLIGCVSCWEFYDQQSHTTTMLQEAGAEVRRNLIPEDARLHKMLKQTFAQIRSDEQDEHLVMMQGRISTLKSVFAPYCGAMAAQRALHVAAKNSPARSLDQLRDENWEPFMERLTLIAAAICGDTFASLVKESGRD